MLIIYLSFLLAIFWYFCISKKPECFPVGPFFRLPFLGHMHLLFANGKDMIKSVKNLRKKYGDIYYVEFGPNKMIMINDLKTMEEISNQEVFSGRFDVDTALNEDFAGKVRGGHGHHGLISSFGPEWTEQRRFALRNLRDLGFGKSSMDDVIKTEYLELANEIKELIKNGEEEIETSLLFNLSVLNVIWSMIMGKRLDNRDPAEKAKMQRVAEMFASFGVGSTQMMVSMLIIPKQLRKFDMFMKKVGRFYHEIFSWFDDEYNEHEKTYDSASMRDFIDIYMRERKRVAEEGIKDSSFYGESGHWNFVNGVFDLFLAGSETTSTSLTYLCLYMAHFPSIQRKLQKEISEVTGGDLRMPEIGDRDKMHYMEAVLTELQRYSMIAPFGVIHSTLHDVTFKGYKLPKNTIIQFNLCLVLRDPENFENPDKFDPERFLDENGVFKNHPAMIAFGLGKRECLGKNLAKMEMFLFSSCLLQQFNIEPGYGNLPDLNDTSIAVTRVPAKFKVRFVPREN